MVKLPSLLSQNDKGKDRQGRPMSEWVDWNENITSELGEDVTWISAGNSNQDEIYAFHKRLNSMVVIAMLDLKSTSLSKRLIKRQYVQALDKAIQEYGQTDPALILNAVHVEIEIDFIAPASKAIKPGARMGILVIDSRTRKGSFSGARIDLFVENPAERKIARVAGIDSRIGDNFESIREFTATSIDTRDKRLFMTNLDERHRTTFIRQLASYTSTDELKRELRRSLQRAPGNPVVLCLK